MKRLSSSCFCMICILVFTNCESKQEKLLLNYLDEYRSAKSLEFVTTGKVITPRIKAYWLPSFYTVTESRPKKIYVLNNKYTLKSIQKVHGLIGPSEKGERIEIWINEKIIGYLENKKLVRESDSITTLYVLVLTADGPKIYMEDMLSDNYILEKDLQSIVSANK